MNPSDFDSASQSLVCASALTKRYGSLTAVDHLDFRIEKGDIFGFIGPDGAGKTSLFHILGGVTGVDEGSISVLGQDPRQGQVKADIGYLTQAFSLYLDLSIDENINYSGALKKVPGAQLSQRKKELTQLMNLDRFSSRLAGQLSGGMKQKLALCCALVSRPKLLLLDEPTTGVDPVSRRELWDILARIAQEGVTVVVATPYLDEAERCNRIALVYEGKIEAMGSPETLKEELGLKRLETRTDDLEKLHDLLEQVPEIDDIQRFGDRLDLLAKDSDVVLRTLEEVCSSNNIKFDTTLESPTLENVFVHELRRELSQEDEGLFAFSGRQRMAPGAKAIDASHLSRRFGDFWAVNDVSLSVKTGEIFGLLGANGAGKTTTIKMLCGLLSSSAGEMSLCGQAGDLRSADLRRRLGYMSQKFTLYDDLTISENLKFYCRVYGIEDSLRPARIAWALNSCGLAGQENLITGKLPGGWKQRLAFGACVMHEPDVLFLDEPTSGVDPLARRQLWKLIRQLAAKGTAILVTTHFLEEAEHCNNLAFMVAGEIVARGSPLEIKSQQPGLLLELKVSDSQKAVKILRERVEDWQVSIFADRIHLVITEEDNREELLGNLQEAGIDVLSIRQVPFSLEDSFIGIVQRMEAAARRKAS